MTEEERLGVRNMINQTIERLQKASVGANHMGSRYARLLQLLWRKPPKRNGRVGDLRHQSIDGRFNAPTAVNQNDNSQPQNFDPNNFNAGMGGMGGTSGMNPPLNGTGAGFSWLDLGATWNFATQNNGGNSSSGSAVDSADDGMGLDATGLSPFDLGMLTDYNLLEGDNPSLIF
jgi:hypothetical protein